MRRAHAVERTLRRLTFWAVGCKLDDLVPCLRGTFEILLAERLDDPDVQERFRMLRIELQRVLELRESSSGANAAAPLTKKDVKQLFADPRGCARLESLVLGSFTASGAPLRPSAECPPWRLPDTR